MKRLIGLIIIGVAVGFTGCNDPKETDCIYQDERFCDPDFNGGDIGRGIVEFSGNVSNYSSKVMLEDFTGFRCTNCLPATVTAQNLKEDHPERLTIIGVHCTNFFAAPLTDDPNEPYHTDFRTPEGEAFVSHYQIAGLPTGVVNRQGTESTSTIPFSQWEQRVNNLLSTNNPEVYIEIEDVILNEDSTEASIHLIAKPLITSAISYLLNVAITEDGIEEAQKNSDSPGGEILDYVHNHVLRYTGYGPFGIPAFTGDVTLETNQALAFELLVEINEEWVLDNCEVIVYASNEQSLNVVQVEEAHLLE